MHRATPEIVKSVSLYASIRHAVLTVEIAVFRIRLSCRNKLQWIIRTPGAFCSLTS